jgi:hypothetical protein
MLPIPWKPRTVIVKLLQLLSTHIRVGLACNGAVVLIASSDSDEFNFTDVAHVCEETTLSETQAV